MTRVRSFSSSRRRSSTGVKPSISNETNPSGVAPGLVILHGTRDDQADGVQADIVVIHGLSGHFLRTWTTEDSVCWPRDLLPKMTHRIGVTRIMTFGYAAGQAGTKVDLDIEDAAWKLIHDLEAFRGSPEQRNRPLIFVVHSLGGLVLKKALIISNNILDLRHILWSVVGITFLATPHRGSAIADIADRIQRFTAIPSKNREFIKDLKLSSPHLAIIAEDFRQIVQQRKLPIASFYELRTFKAMPCMKSVVVSKDSAILHVPSEKLYGAERDHRSITKYDSENDEVFQQVLLSVSDFMKKGTVSSSARVFIPWDSSSHFKGRRDILQQLHETFFPQSSSTSAVIDSEQQSHRRVAMIFGDGGLGKTEITLKFARENEYRYNYIFFAESTSVQTLRTEIVSIHDSLGLPKSAERELRDLREFLAQQESWLFIMDNDNDFLSLNHFKFPDVNHGHILITCRSREYTTDPRLNRVIHMPPMDVQEASDLLFSRAGISIIDRVGLEEEVTTLVETLGCVPAMVENTAAYMVSFEVDVPDCLKLMSHRSARRSLLSYHSSSARYKLSADSLFRIRLDSLQKHMPTAYYVLSALVWLDRTKTTKSFFTRAVGNRRRWATNGEPEERPARSTFVPDEFIQLVEGPEFDIAMTNLKHSSLIARDEVFDHAMGTKGSFVLHPSLYQYLRDSTAQEDAIKAICPALSLVAHAHPILQGGLEKSIPLKLQMTYQIQQVLENIDEISALSSLRRDLHNAFQEFWGLRAIEFCEAIAEVLLEAIGNYGADDETDKKLISLIAVLLKNSKSVFLRTRFWSKRLPLEYYKHGKLYEGCAAADKYLNELEGEANRQGWTNRDNAEVGTLRALTVEYREDEPDLNARERWQKRVDFINAWQPLNPEEPSTLERYVVGLGVRMRGKLAKDFGQFKEAYYDLKQFCERYADHGSREEGWAIGDFAQLVLELEETEDGPEIFADLANNGTNFGNKVCMAEGMRPCDLTAYVTSRAVDSRMFERGYLTPDARLNARESDTMWLEMMHAMTLVRICKYHPERFAAAEAALLSLSERFQRIEAVESWYDEQIRHFAIKCSLAQVSHMQKDWPEAQLRWADAIQYGREKVGDWKGENYYIEVAKYSLADAQCSEGVDPREVISVLGDTIKTINGKRVKWMLGMGTYWLDFVHERMVPRIEAVTRLSESGVPEDKMAALAVVLVPEL